MKLAIIGYGKMGKAVEKIAKEKGHEIIAIIDPNCDSCLKEINENNLRNVETCIDFTSPTAVIENIRRISRLGKNIVVGTTGWYEKMDEVEKIVKDNNIGLIWSGNFSIGVNALFAIVEKAAKIFNNLEEYDVLAHELHHRNKADSPSGTAKMLGKILVDNIDRKKKVVYEMLGRKVAAEEIHFSSTRGGLIPGTHAILFDSAVDTIEITHTARGREGFATGAVMAAEFISGKKGFYSIDDLMKKIIGGG
ncbi:4-hydroxy-tetrahydrodipicolinate reductase [Candidatus Woesearchaeota archaeon]|nr:4-hydroxy-tetrahydrodipicolinate reductase [Candidatus Woesearchaeota archaeon]